MTNAEKRKAVHEFCVRQVGCYSCPIAEYDKGHRCGTGLIFLNSDGRPGSISDLEVLGAYILAFPEEKKMQGISAGPTATLMNSTSCGTIIHVDSKQKISAVNIMFQEDESE